MIHFFSNSNENEQYDPPEIRTVCIIGPVGTIGT